MMSVEGKMKAAATPVERIERAILMLRGHKVMFDADLAALYGVETRVLVQAVKRNPGRFPRDFMFQLTHQELTGRRGQCNFFSRCALRAQVNDQELAVWRSRIVMSNPGAALDVLAACSGFAFPPRPLRPPR